MKAHFGVLGTLDVQHDGQSLLVQSRRQRAILARLLLSPGQIVTPDVLIACAWDEEIIPDHPHSALQNHISRLRKTLGPLRCSLATSSAGYALRADGDEVDSLKFERLVAEARRARATDVPAALGGFEQAQALWRGPAFAEFAESFARPQAIMLEQMRVTAAEQRIGLLLGTGAYSRATEEAESVIAAHPLRESAYALRMRALALADQVSDALAAYQHLRRQLAEEYGTEPSAGVRHLYVQLLRGEIAPVPEPPTRPPTLSSTCAPNPHSAADPTRTTAAPPASAPASAPAPTAADSPHPPAPSHPVAAVPTSLSTFVGRQDEIQRVLDVLSHRRVVTLVGPGGVGKTRLAMETAPRLAEDSALRWVELSSVRDPELVPHACLDALGVPDPPTGTALDALTIVLRRRDLTLILDNCEHVVDGVAETITRIAQSCPGVRFLATSRERLAVDGEQVIAIPPLSLSSDDGSSEAVRLLVDRMSAAGFEVDLRDPATWDRAHLLGRRMDGLPLAIELAAATAASLGLEAVVHGVNPLGMTGGTRTAHPRHQDLRELLMWSYDLLTGEEKALLRRLAAFPGWFSVGWAEEVCTGGDLPRDRVAPTLASLVAKSLVVRRPLPLEGGRRHRLLATVAGFAEERCDAAGELDRFRRAHARHTVSWAVQAAGMIAGGREEEQSIALLSAGASDLRATQHWALRHDRPLALELSSALMRYGFIRADYEILGWAEKALEQTGADEPPLHPHIYGSAALAALGRGELELAEQRAQEAIRVAGSERSALPGLTILAHCLLFTERPAKSVEICEKMWPTVRSGGGGDSVNEVEVAGIAAICLSYAGDRAAAEEWIECCRRCRDRSSSALVAAYAAYFTGEAVMPHDPDRALAELRRSYDIASRIGATFVAGVAKTSFATLRARHAPTAASFVFYGHTLRHWHDHGNRTQLWVTIRNLIPLLSGRGEDERAVAVHAAMTSSTAAPRVYGPELAAIERSVEESRRRLGPSGAEDVRSCWRGADLTAVFDLAVESTHVLARSAGDGQGASARSQDGGG
ncbi:BTAD domain-containing putative transcriptional regulator [Streptomyces sp. NPDC048639]|uniref:AfsR/SARP family transcriptional regulator n=1 Tax=Streptomyces sp. NPDC048639 TaxID=3365581 RepID=UPI003711BC5C